MSTTAVDGITIHDRREPRKPWALTVDPATALVKVEVSALLTPSEVDELRDALREVHNEIDRAEYAITQAALVEVRTKARFG